VRSDTRYQFPGERRRRFVGLLVGLASVGILVVTWLAWPSKPAPQSRPRPLPPKVKPLPKAGASPTSKAPLTLPTNALALRMDARGSTNRVSAPIAALLEPGLEAGRAHITLTNAAPRAVRGILETQLALDRLALSPGSLDGTSGSRTRNALKAFQERERLRPSGELDAATRRRLFIVEPIYADHVVASNDLSRLQPLGRTWMEKWHQQRLEYETLLELVAEKAHAHPNLILQLNPGVDWSNVVAGTALRVPNVMRPPVPEKAASIRILLADRVLRAFDEKTNLLAHFPCSIARSVDKRPVGQLHVAVFVQGPNYTFDPANFPNSAEARELKTKLVLPPGPNNPVGSVWIGLDKPGYGIHGTPHPEQVGQAESLGCFRLANWNAEYLLQLVWVGLPVYVEP
jgi:lipoprotein-anchoring transpeptidase ErfK/SrfK